GQHSHCGDPQPHGRRGASALLPALLGEGTDTATGPWREIGAGCSEKDHANGGALSIFRGPYHEMVTCERVKVDRVACPCLIRKFIDPQAEFLFVPEDNVMEVATREGAIPYDVKGVEFGHLGKECSFDALVKKHQIDRDPAIVLLAK